MEELASMSDPDFKALAENVAAEMMARGMVFAKGETTPVVSTLPPAPEPAPVDVAAVLDKIADDPGVIDAVTQAMQAATEPEPVPAPAVPPASAEPVPAPARKPRKN